METNELQAISQTILRLATPDMKPKKLFKAVREAHPDASRKEIMRAAFLAVIARSHIDPEGAKQLHDVVMDERGGDAGASGELAAMPLTGARARSRAVPKGKSAPADDEGTQS